MASAFRRKDAADADFRLKAEASKLIFSQALKASATTLLMKRRDGADDAERHLPLKPLVFQVLLALADGERHGWSLVREVQQRGGFGRMMPGNFYRTLRACWPAG